MTGGVKALVVCINSGAVLEGNPALARFHGELLEGIPGRKVAESELLS